MKSPFLSFLLPLFLWSPDGTLGQGKDCFECSKTWDTVEEWGGDMKCDARGDAGNLRWVKGDLDCTAMLIERPKGFLMQRGKMPKDGNIPEIVPPSNPPNCYVDAQKKSLYCSFFGIPGKKKKGIEPPADRPVIPEPCIEMLKKAESGEQTSGAYCVMGCHQGGKAWKNIAAWEKDKSWDIEMDISNGEKCSTTAGYCLGTVLLLPKSGNKTLMYRGCPEKKPFEEFLKRKFPALDGQGKDAVVAFRKPDSKGQDCSDVLEEDGIVGFNCWFKPDLLKEGDEKVGGSLSKEFAKEVKTFLETGGKATTPKAGGAWVQPTKIHTIIVIITSFVSRLL